MGKKKKLEIEKVFNTNLEDNNLKGTWYIVQWIPDQYACERISIGVLFVREDLLGHKCKFLKGKKQTYFFNSIYGEKASFHIELTIDLAKKLTEEIKTSQYTSIEREMIDVVIQYGGYASGKDEKEIVNRLFEDVVKKPNMD